MILKAIQKVNQGMPNMVDVVKATVTSINPITLSIDGDSDANPSDELVMIAERLSNHDIEIDFSQIDEGHLEIDSVVPPEISWNDYHTKLQTFSGTMTLKNALAINDRVVCISFNYGSVYLVIDRVVE